MQIQMAKSHLFPIAVIATVMSCIGLLEMFYPQLDSDYGLTFSPSQLTQMLLSVAAMIATALSVLPAQVVAIANGMAFGPVVGFALTWTGGLIGACIGFYAARLLGRKPILRLLGTSRFAILDAWVDRHGVLVFLLARLIPFIPFFLLNYGAGLANLRFASYLSITAIGIIPMALLCVTLGDRVMDADWQAILIIASLAILLAGAVFWLRSRPAHLK